MKPFDQDQPEAFGKTRPLLRFVLLSALFATSLYAREESLKDNSAKLIAPAVSTGTGLLLEPALTLPEFTREKFAAVMAPVDTHRLPVSRLVSHDVQATSNHAS